MHPTPRLTFLLVVAIAPLGLPALCVAQEATPVLAGVDSVNAIVSVTWGARNSVITGDQYEQQVRNGFELGLLRAGLRLSAIGAPDGVVECTVVTVGSPTIGYAVSVAFHELMYDEDTFELRAAATWSHMQAIAGGQSSVNGQDEGQWCAEQFEIEWRKANN